MPYVTIMTGPSKGIDVEVDRIPVEGDFIFYQGQNYQVQEVYLQAGGGTRVGVQNPPQVAGGEGAGIQSEADTD